MKSNNSRILKRDLVQAIHQRLATLDEDTVNRSVMKIMQAISTSIALGERVEIRGFGSFIVRERKPRTGRNPRTGETVEVAGKHVVHFKPGKEMRESVNAESTSEDSEN